MYFKHCCGSREENKSPNLWIGEELPEKRAKEEPEGRPEIRNDVHTPDPDDQTCRNL
jgi:hypothetical protein